MKRYLLAALVFGVLFACPHFTVWAEEPSGAAPQGVAAQEKAAPAAPVAPPAATQGGTWVQVPGESIGGRWVPPHQVFVPNRPVPQGAQPVYVPYGPAGVYVAAPSPTFPTVLADLLVLRPLGIAGLALGTGAAIVAMPFAIPSGSAGEVGHALITEPFDFTFKRPLGVW